MGGRAKLPEKKAKHDREPEVGENLCKYRR